MSVAENDVRSQILRRQRPEDSELFGQYAVSILGCGGLGSNIALMLARAGVGKLYLYDFDRIEYSNLNRQNYTFNEIGQLKVEATKARLESTIPYAKVEAFACRVTPELLDQEATKRSTLFIEAFDNQESKAMALDYFMNHTQYSVITASGLSGLGDVRNVQVKYANNICMIGDFASSPEQGLYLPYVSVIASTQALEALKWMKNGGTYAQQ